MNVSGKSVEMSLVVPFDEQLSRSSSSQDPAPGSHFWFRIALHCARAVPPFWEWWEQGWPVGTVVGTGAARPLAKHGGDDSPE